MQSLNIDPSGWAQTHRDCLSVQYTTQYGACVVGTSETVLSSAAGRDLQGQVQLVFTSPPFPLNKKKRYGNEQGDAYKQWLKHFAPLLRDVLRPDGSIVIELGNAWEPGLPVMSTLAIESLLAFREAADLYLCQEFIWHNPAKLPTPAQWVTIERIRVKDSFTRLWWLSPNPKPKANNRRVLVPYSPSMVNLLKTGKYNGGKRPSEHYIGANSFLSDNGGAIPPNVLNEHMLENVLVGSNTATGDPYQAFCKEHGLAPHPARMPRALADFFIKLCTEEGDLVMDPFSGSNTTGAVAEGLGRSWISIEANETYAASGIGRFPALQGGFVSDTSRDKPAVSQDGQLTG